MDCFDFLEYIRHSRSRTIGNSGSVSHNSSEHSMAVLRPIADIAPQLARWRQTLHSNPELAFQEHATAAFVAERLQELGLEVHSGIGGTGVVATVHGQHAGISLGFRADMDALPMQEESSSAYRSRNTGQAHACGHDGHTTALLGLAHYLSRHPPQSGTVQLIFQPAEETASGAMRMLEDGLLERFPCDEVYAFHNMPLLPAGSAGVRVGPVLNGYTIWQVDIEGLGGHGAAPHKANNPLQAAAQLAGEIAGIVGRYIDPMVPAVITPCSLHSGSSYNIIPSRATLSGTLRSLVPATQDLLLERLRDVCEAVARMTGCTLRCEVINHCPPCVNSAGPTQTARDAIADVLGAQQTVNHEPLPFTDDFAHLLNARPGAYLFIGQAGVMCHDARFDFDDSLLPVAASIFARIIERRLANPAA